MKEENKNMCEQCANCSCFSCCSCHACRHQSHRYFFLRWFLGLAVLAMVFGLGMKVGEFKGLVENGYLPFSYHTRGYNYGPTMMSGSNYGFYPDYNMMGNVVPSARVATSTR